MREQSWTQTTEIDGEYKPYLPSIITGIVRSLDNKMDELATFVGEVSMTVVLCVSQRHNYMRILGIQLLPSVAFGQKGCKSSSDIELLDLGSFHMHSWSFMLRLF